MSLRVVFFGTPSFAAHILEFLLVHKQKIVGVVTRPDRPKGRSQQMSASAVKSLILQTYPEIPLFQPEKASTDSFALELKNLSPDVFVVAAYGEILKKNILEVPKKMCINVHPSLLPKYRGATPIRSALFNGDTETGVTIIEMVLAMDAGDMLEVVSTPIFENMNFGELEKILWKLSGPALLRVLEKIQKNTIKKTPQNSKEVTFSKKISAKDCMIDWNQTAEEIHNQVRALSPKPGAFTIVKIGGKDKRLGIKKTKKVLNVSAKPGETIVFQKNQWIVACGQRALSLLEVQLEGKKSLEIQEFLKGISIPLTIKI